jgi:hypothetical protein
MPRPYLIVEKPIMTPYVCIQCGLGGPPREWFVDLGFAVDHYFDVNTQAVYLCNECYHNMSLDIGRLLIKFRADHEKWESGEAPSYSWLENQVQKRNDDVRESESGEQNSGTGEAQQLDATTPVGTDRDDQDSEPDDSEPESSDSGDADSTDDSDPDEQSGLKVTFGEHNS